MALNLFQHLPSTKAATGRSTTLDAKPWRAPAKKSGRVQRADDPNLWLQTLVSTVGGRDLRDVVGFFAEGLPRIIGVDDLTENNFTAFLSGFAAAMTELGLTDGATPSLAVRKHRSAMEGDLPPMPSPMGVTVRTRQDVPRAVWKFDEFAAMASNSTALSDAVAAGNGDGIPPGLSEVLSALFGALRASVLVNDANAIRRVGEDFGALAAALFEATQAPPTQRASEPGFTSRRLKKIGPGHWVQPGHVPVRKAGNEIKSVKVGDEMVPVDQVEFRDGQPRRRNRKRA